MDSEVKKFERKAIRYATALSAVPSARNAEVLPISAILAATACASDSICDVMSGTGYLTSFLRRQFQDVVSVEACSAMDAYSDIKAIPVSDAAQIPSVLRDLQPVHCVSLASFHHLLAERPAQAVQLQLDLVTESFNAVAGLKSFLVVDVEDSFRPLEHNDQLPWSDKGVPAEHFFGVELGAKVSEYSLEVQERFLVKEPDPCRWFRDVVDPNSLVGHTDCFLNSSLLDGLGSIDEIDFACTKIPTPWVFPDMERLRAFIWDKFVFQSDYISVDEVVAAAHKHLGIKVLKNGSVALGWQLAFILVTRIS